MKFILQPKALLTFLCILVSLKSLSQVHGSFMVNGTIDKFYPVVFTDSAWEHSVASELEIGRSGVHRDAQSEWRGSVIAKFRYHTNNWGNYSNFIDADIRQYNYTTANPYDKFIAGWKDATAANGAKIIIIWLRGNTSYDYVSRYNDKVFVHDGTAAGPLPYTEPNGASYTFKTAIDNYVNYSGSTYSSNTYSLGGYNYFSGNVGIGITSTAARLEVAGIWTWTTAGWYRTIKLGRAQSIELDAGARKFGIGATGDSLLCFFSSDADTVNLPAKYAMAITNSGNIGIGTLTPKSYKLAVEGTLGARRIKVTQQPNWADFVLHPDYKLPDLKDVEKFIHSNGHLPEIPSAKEVKENGVDIGEMNKLLLQKVEELTLYVIQQQKEITELKASIKKH